MFSPSGEIYRDRLCMCILIHVFPSCLLLLLEVFDIFISVYEYKCTHWRSLMLHLCYPSPSYSIPMLLLIYLQIVRCVYVLVWFLFYSFHVNYTRSFHVTILYFLNQIKCDDHFPSWNMRLSIITRFVNLNTSITPWSFISCIISCSVTQIKHGAYITHFKELSVWCNLHDIEHTLKSVLDFKNSSATREFRRRIKMLPSRSAVIEFHSVLMLSVPFLTTKGLMLASGFLQSVEEISTYFGTFLLLLDGVGSSGYSFSLQFLVGLPKQQTYYWRTCPVALEPWFSQVPKFLILIFFLYWYFLLFIDN